METKRAGNFFFEILQVFVKDWFANVIKTFASLKKKLFYEIVSEIHSRK